MKRIIPSLVLCVLFAVGVAFAEPDMPPEDEEDKPFLKCAHWGFEMEWQDCTDCHLTPSFKVKKTRPHREHYVALPAFADVREINNELVIHYLLSGIESNAVDTIVNYALHNDFSHIILEIHSPGGSLFDAQRIVGILNYFKSHGGKVTTIVNGFAASAGFYIYMEGDERLIDPTAQLMWHELYTFKFFDISGPSDSEDEARVLRHLQDTVNEWLAGRCNLDKEELDAMIKKKELWANGKQALEYGFAHAYTRMEDK